MVTIFGLDCTGEGSVLTPSSSLGALKFRATDIRTVVGFRGTNAQENPVKQSRRREATDCIMVGEG